MRGRVVYCRRTVRRPSGTAGLGPEGFLTNHVRFKEEAEPKFSVGFHCLTFADPILAHQSTCPWKRLRAHGRCFSFSLVIADARPK